MGQGHEPFRKNSETLNNNVDLGERGKKKSRSPPKQKPKPGAQGVTRIGHSQKGKK